MGDMHRTRWRLLRTLSLSLSLSPLLSLSLSLSHPHSRSACQSLSLSHSLEGAGFRVHASPMGDMQRTRWRLLRTRSRKNS